MYTYKILKKYSEFAALLLSFSFVLLLMMDEKVSQLAFTFYILLILVSWQFHQFSMNWNWILPRVYWSSYLFFHNLALLTLGVVTKNISLFFMSFIPFFVNLYFNTQSSKKDGVILIAISFSYYIFLSKLTGFNERIFFYNSQGIFFFASFIWCLGILFFAVTYKGKSVFSRSKLLTDQNSEEQLFFHDLINQTHGLNLFLQHKESLGLGLTIEEAQSIRQEIKGLQTVMKDHFKMDHKNLTNSYEWQAFQKLWGSFVIMVESYLPKYQFDVKIHLDDSFKKILVSPYLQKDLFHQPTFNRIMNNAIKNIAESKSKEVEFDFQAKDGGVLIIIKNKIINPLLDLNNLAHELEMDILNDFKPKEVGRGLDSIQYLCQRSGGHFQFSFENNVWVVEIFLPGKESNLLKSEEKRRVA